MPPPPMWTHPHARRQLCTELYTVRGWPFGKITRRTGTALSQLAAWKQTYGWVQATRAPGGVRYAVDLKREVLGTLSAVGVLAEVARQTLIPKRTIGRWRDAKLQHDAPPPNWRCYCTPYGVVVAGDACPRCHRPRAP